MTRALSDGGFAQDAAAAPGWTGPAGTGLTQRQQPRVLPERRFLPPPRSCLEGSPHGPGVPVPPALPRGGARPHLAAPTDVTQVVPSWSRPRSAAAAPRAPRPAVQSPAGGGRGGRAPANGERINTSCGGGARRDRGLMGVRSIQ